MISEENVTIRPSTKLSMIATVNYKNKSSHFYSLKNKTLPKKEIEKTNRQRKVMRVQNFSQGRPLEQHTENR